MVSQISDKFGKEAPLTLTRGKVHNYLGIKIDYTNEGQVKFPMHEYVHK